MFEASILFRPDSEALKFLPEGPYPLGNDCISWVAIQHGADATTGSLNILDLNTRVNQSYPLPGRPGFAFPCADNQSFIVGCERTLGIFRPHDLNWQVLCEGIDREVSGTIINDGVVYGRHVVFGCKDLKFQEAKAGLYLWNGEQRRLLQLRNDQTCSNGKAIRRIASGGTESLELVDIDTPTRQVAAYSIDFDKGVLGERRVLLDLRDQVGFPDGAILSPDENSIIISFYNPDPAPAGETREYDLRTGEVLRVWRTPGSPQATCPQLVPHQGKIKLVITTAVEHMPTERRAGAPEAGSLFIADTDFQTAGSVPKYPG